MPFVSVNGVDGSGKTTLAANLQARLEHSRAVPEFSDTDLGKFLSATVRQSPHFISESELAQSLLFLAEYADRVDALRRELAIDPTIVLVAERGWLSKYAYQVCVLERRFAAAVADQLVTTVLSMTPKEDASILLRASETTLQERLRARPTVLDEAYLSFLRRADELMVSAAKRNSQVLVLDTTDMTPSEVTSAAMDFIGTTARPPR